MYHPHYLCDDMIPTPAVGVMLPDLQPLVSCYNSHLYNPSVELFSGSLVWVIMVKKSCIALWYRSYASSLCYASILPRKHFPKIGNLLPSTWEVPPGIVVADFVFGH